MFGRLGMQELILILALVLLIFGPKRLPEIGKSIGRGLREFRSATKDIQKSISLDDDEEEEEATKEKSKVAEEKEDEPSKTPAEKA